MLLKRCKKHNVLHEYERVGDMELKPHEKYMLSIKEAAEYSGIGSDRLREIFKDNPDLDFIIRRGDNQILIHRIKFEKWVMSLRFI